MNSLRYTDSDAYPILSFVQIAHVEDKIKTNFIYFIFFCVTSKRMICYRFVYFNFNCTNISDPFDWNSIEIYENFV